MRDLVTGATGFTGGHLARSLAARGHTVRALVRRRLDAAHLVREGIEIVTGDLRDPDSVRAALEGVDVVYNIAALYRQAGLPEESYRAVNARAVGTMIDHFKSLVASTARRAGLTLDSVLWQGDFDGHLIHDPLELAACRTTLKASHYLKASLPFGSTA